ncbi:MAG: HAMP domain-containing protein [Acidobacteriota bacterium]
MRLSLKLGALCAAAAFIPLLIISLLTLSEVSAHARQQALEQLGSDARVAVSLYEKRLIEMRAMAQALADEIANRALVSTDSLDRNNPASWARLQDLLPRVQTEASLDFVIVTDPLGRVIARHNDRPSPGETLLGSSDKNPIAERVIAGGNLPAASCVIERGERYARLGLDRIAQVRLLDGSTIDEALMIEAGAPIFSSGRFVGVVLAGQMLNTYYKARASANPLQTPLVAEARQTLYRNGEEDAGAVIALGSAIVASSVPPDGTRESSSGPALAGALHDPTKTEEAFQSGARGYSVAWQPLKSLDGTAIGAIGVARPAKELEGPVNAVRATTILIGAIASLLAAAAGFMFGRGLGARLDELTQAASRWSLGDLSTPARDREPFLARWIPAEYLRDEITQLAEQLNQMRETFRQAIERIRKR